MKSNNNIYSIHTHNKGSGLLHLETVIAGGIYNFSILGIPAKYAADIKHKVYVSLRSENVLNLKSDNRKITTNIIADREDVIPTHAELATALSCAQCLVGDITHFPTLAVGGLSITGKIIPSNKLLSAIYLALKHNINHISCSEKGIKNLQPCYIQYAQKEGIEFFVGNNIKEIFDNLKNHLVYRNTFAIDLNNEEYSCTQIQSTLTELKQSHIVWSMFVSICGKHSIMFETDNSPFIEEAADLLSKCIPTKPLDQQFELSHRSTCDDVTFQNRMSNYTYTKIVPHAQKKEEIDTLTSFVFLENASTLNIDAISRYYSSSDLLRIATCLYCPCGNKGLLNKKCLCIQRNILRYQHKINTDHRSHYMMWASHHTGSQHPIPTFTDMKVITHVITLMHSNTQGGDLDIKSRKMYVQLSENLNLHQKTQLISLATTLQQLTDIEEGGLNQTKRPTLISTKNLLLAFSYLPRMDS